MSGSKKIRGSIEKASWVRKMFEEGALRKERYGPENVFDFSLGNPNIEPPAKFKEVLKELASDDSLGKHRYMPNAGFIETRKAVADYLSNLNKLSFGPEDIVMTVGAAGALNVVLKAILNQGDEVIIPAPYFMEYSFYIDNYGGISKTVNYKDNRIDIGGHRFFSKSDRVMKWWLNILPLQGAPSRDDLANARGVPLSEGFDAPDPEKSDRVMLTRSRLSRIFFLRKFFDYPISLNLNTFSNLGLKRIIKIFFSYITQTKNFNTSFKSFIINIFTIININPK